MSRIDELIAELCPDGVEFKELGEVITSLRTGLNPRQNFTLNPSGAENYYVTVRELGGFDVRVSGKTDRVDDVGLALIQNRSKLQAGDVLFSGTGTIGRTAFVAEKPDNWNIKEGVYAITPDPKAIHAKFLIYLFHTSTIRCQILAQADGSTVASIGMAILKKIRIPVPPLEVQREVVKILDTFTKLEAELEAELEARQRQYKYYRDALLGFDDRENIRWATLGEIGNFVRGSGIQKSDFTESGVGCIHYGQIHTHYGTWANESKSFISPDFAARLRKARTGDLVIATTSEDDEAVAKAVAWLGDENVAVSTDAYIFQHSLNPKYVSYFFQTELFQSQKKPHITGTKVRRISGESMAKIRMPVPPLDEQERIVAILDKFDTLVNDLSSGLPAELKARRQQYAHYRDRLLSFREAA
ncbi:MAG: restriction endonuclease subunit S [Desulfobacteraceae bacterium]|nr:restriction endonuclease subunit S [Desulfobacteraceae bacterium]